MINITVNGMGEIRTLLNSLPEKKIPAAVMIALNSTAYHVLQESKRRIQTAFDRPTPWIVNSTRYKKATKQDLSALIYIDPKRKYLMTVHETSGYRGLQHLEKLLRDKGELPSGYRVVPTDSCPKNQYGNPDAKIMREVKNWIRSGMLSPRTKSGKISSSRNRFFLRGKGIYQVNPKASSLKDRRQLATLMFVIMKIGLYKPRLHWDEMANRETLRLFPTELNMAIQRILHEG